MVCSVDGCNNKHSSRGYCRTHYTRWIRHKDPNYTKYEMHNHCKHPLYDVYRGMKARCNNPNAKYYYCYGGRGIKICDRWKKSFLNFLEDVGERPKGMSLDRIDNDGDYEPNNVKWSTQTEQNLNRRPQSNTRIYPGVIFTPSKKWAVVIKRNKVSNNLGTYETLTEALSARLAAEAEFK